MGELRTLLETLGTNVTDAQLSEYMAALDADGNGVIDYEEFKLWYLSGMKGTQGLKQRLKNGINALKGFK